MQAITYHDKSARQNYWGRHNSDQPVSSGALQLSPLSNRASAHGISIFLRPTEFRLLHFLMSHPDQVYRREELLDEIWGDWVVIGARTVDVHIRRLRATLQPFGLDKLVQTVHCRGYLFSSSATSDQAQHPTN